MSYDLLVGLNVLDDKKYQEYRNGMRAILASHGGSFGYDFRVSEVLTPAAGGDINRVFTIRFPDREASERFFSNPDYLAVREQHFEASVASTTIIAGYDTSDQLP